MINKIEHLGIAVKNIETSNALFAKILGKEHYKTELVESESVITSFFKIGEQKTPHICEGLGGPTWTRTRDHLIMSQVL